MVQVKLIIIQYKIQKMYIRGEMCQICIFVYITLKSANAFLLMLI